MVSKQSLQAVAESVRQHCAAKGYAGGSNWNPLIPQDSVAAWAMAKDLAASGAFDEYIAIAPEGHVYGYFFEQFGARVLSIFVDYPPTRAEALDDLSVVHGRRVLLIEDDVVSGISLELALKELEQHQPNSVSLYLGREKDSHQLENVPCRITRVYLAEDHLNLACRDRYESEFLMAFQQLRDGSDRSSGVE